MLDREGAASIRELRDTRLEHWAARPINA